MESSEQNRTSISEVINLPHSARVWLVGLLDVVLSKYSNKFNDLTTLIFMMSPL